MISGSVSMGAVSGFAGVVIGALVKKVDFNIAYFELSALARFDAAMGGSGNSMYLLLGPALAIQANCDFSGIPLFGSIGCDEFVKSRDVGIAAGVGVGMPVSDNIALSADLVYTLGVLSIAEESGEDVKNRAINVWLGVSFDVGQ